jgi:hypothetical protein
MHRGNLVAAAGVMVQSSEEAGESLKAAESLGFAQLKDATGVVQVTKNKELQRLEPHRRRQQLDGRD